MDHNESHHASRYIYQSQIGSFWGDCKIARPLRSVESAWYTVYYNIMNIVIFGEIGAGKSSVINLMAGRQIAHISPDARRCTLQWTEYPITFENGTRYQVFDTVGLEEPRLETGEYLSAISNAYSLINTLKERGGVNLLLFCIRGGRVTATIQSNYRLFFEFLCEEKVPLTLVITNLESETTDFDRCAC